MNTELADELNWIEFICIILFREQTKPSRPVARKTRKRRMYNVQRTLQDVYNGRAAWSDSAFIATEGDAQKLFTTNEHPNAIAGSWFNLSRKRHDIKQRTDIACSDIVKRRKIRSPTVGPCNWRAPKLLLSWCLCCVVDSSRNRFAFVSTRARTDFFPARIKPARYGSFSHKSGPAWGRIVVAPEDDERVSGRTDAVREDWWSTSADLTATMSSLGGSVCVSTVFSFCSWPATVSLRIGSTHTHTLTVVWWGGFSGAVAPNGCREGMCARFFQISQ